MDRIKPYVAYFAILSVIQPASIEEIEENVASLLGEEYVDGLVRRGRLRKVHESAKDTTEIIGIGGKRFLISQWARQYTKDVLLMNRSIDNQRFFELKNRRKSYKRFSQNV